MSFVFYPNHEHRCPDLMHCPHVGGAALGYVVSLANENDERRNWLFRQLDAAREKDAAKSQRIAELEERVQQLQAELKAERQKQFKAAKPEEEQASAVASEENQAKKRGAPVGHPGWFRPTPTRTDRTITVPAPASCPHCGAPVLALLDLPPYEHIQEDLIDGRPTVTCYDRHATKIKQKCLEHLKRTAKAWFKVTPEKATASQQFFADVKAWVKRGCRWYRRWKVDSGPEKDREAAWLRDEQARLESVPLDFEKARTLQGRIRRYSAEWLTFLDHPAVPPTNNLAEQAVRFLVILRKVTFGSRTRAGARRFGAMLTVIQTARRQGRNIIHFLVALFTMTPSEAERAMYARC